MSRIKALKAKPKRKSKSIRSSAERSAAMKRSWALRKQIASSLTSGGQLLDTARAAIEHSKRFRLEAPVNAVSNTTPEQPIRGQLLDRAKALTLGDRERQYGDPLTNFILVGKMKALFWAHSEGRSSPWGHAIDMVFTNLARIATAPTPEAAMAEDRYVDMAGYASLAYEVGKRS